MTLFYPGAPGGHLLWAIRLLLGSATAVLIVLGFTAIRCRDIAAHPAWMVRAYAVALGAGTQAVTEGIAEAQFGTGDLTNAISMGFGWAINAVVVEWVIRRPSVRRARRPRAQARAQARVRAAFAASPCTNAPGRTRLPTTNSGSRGTSMSTGRPGLAG
jgi:Predicted membrane protein (DUF2306)